MTLAGGTFILGAATAPTSFVSLVGGTLDLKNFALHPAISFTATNGTIRTSGAGSTNNAGSIVTYTTNSTGGTFTFGG